MSLISRSIHQILVILILFIRHLKYCSRISGDGNFQLERRDKQSTAITQQSWVGDAGFWANQRLFDTYITATEGVPDPQERVSALMMSRQTRPRRRSRT